MSKNTITIEVQLDDNKLPEKINWAASGQENPDNEVKAFLLSLFDSKTGDTLKIDLWTKDMPLDGMHAFIFNTVKAMGRTYSRAVGNKEVIERFDSFAEGLTEFHPDKAK
jgi:gliding motility-associated protein GldC